MKYENGTSSCVEWSMRLSRSRDFVLVTGLILGTLLYTVIGGVIFHFIEKEQEVRDREQAIDTTLDFLGDNGCISRAELNRFVKDIIELYDKGVLVFDDKTDVNNWTIGSAIFFAFTVVTTIGYGHLAPTTVGGRIFTVFFASIGIPLVFVTVAVTGTFIALAIHSAGKKMTKNLYWTCMSMEIVLSVIFAVLAIIIFILLPSLAFTLIEEWSYLESIYYSFITLTTIGFGDFVAALETKPPEQYVYKGLLILWILFGLAWLVLFVTSVTLVVKRVTLIVKNEVNGKIEGHKRKKHCKESNDTKRNGKRSKDSDSNSHITESSTNKDENTNDSSIKHK